jgi:hypothetical protein
MTWATAYGLARLDDPHRVNLIGPTSSGLNRYYAMTTELTKPLIVAQLDVTGHPPSALLIDGINRLYRAWREHVPRVPAYLGTAEETRRIHALGTGPGVHLAADLDDGLMPSFPPRTPRALPAAGGDRGVGTRPALRPHGIRATGHRVCDCRRLAHRHLPRIAYNESHCARTITASLSSWWYLPGRGLVTGPGAPRPRSSPAISCWKRPT